MEKFEVEKRTKPVPTFPIVTKLSDEQYYYFCMGFTECWNYVNNIYNLEIKKNEKERI